VLDRETVTVPDPFEDGPEKRFVEVIDTLATNAHEMVVVLRFARDVA
jgi:hypothetical protein